MNHKWTALLLCGLACLGWGCRRDMQDQPKYKTLAQSSFFGDDKASRPLVEDTVARGHLDEDKALYEGKDANGKDISFFPVPVTQAMMERGQQRYDIFCSPCHDHTGSGYGMVVRRGYKQPPSFHIDRLRNAPSGYYFDVISHGFGSMPDYATQIPPADRWAIIAYIRALQYSAHASISDVPETELKKLEGTSPQ
ncbi:MAG TPA: cytochrome c [Acidobacteriota bacterium]|nr:cytochrome c [Acidobacteriota bacterium]